MIGRQDHYWSQLTLVALLSLFCVTSAFVLTDEEIQRLSRRDNADITNKLEFFFDEDTKPSRPVLLQTQPKSFPRTFKMRLSSLNASQMFKFIKIDKPADQPKLKPDIYTIDSQTGQPYKYMNGNDGLDFELYKQENGKGIATLLRNGKGSQPDLPHRQPFRMLGTIYSDDTSPSIALDIMPIQNEKARKILKRQAGLHPDENVDNHRIHKRILNRYGSASAFDPTYPGDAYAVFKREIAPLTPWEVERAKHLAELKRNSSTEQLSRKLKRALNGAPITLNVEVCVVTDLSLYNKHKEFQKEFLELEDDPTQDLVFSYMQVYYIYFMNAVNQRFANSLSSDADLRINIVTTNLLFLTSVVNWTNTSLVGDSAYPIYNNKTVLAAQPTLDTFTRYMTSLSLPSYDYAIGLTNNDIWSSLSGTPAQRSQTMSFSYIGQICTSNSYSIAEEIGGFANIDVVAQETGKILGSYYDGDNTPLSINCQPSSNYIMTPVLGAYSSNLANLYLFSPCSIAQFKNLLLTNLNTAVSSSAQCLVNTPTVQAIAQYTVYGLPGQSLSADDQCKYRYGLNATFCTSNSSIMCSALPCRINENATTCTATYGFGAAEGTICGSGQICSGGKCVNSTLAPTTSCPFNDDVIVNNTIISDSLPFTQMTCTEVILYLLGQNKYPFSYCNQTNFRQACCKTCQVYDKFTCVDQNAACPSYSSYCADLVVTLNGSLVGNVCKRTCGVCTQNALTCADQMCQNGAACVDGIQTPNKLINFGCSCNTGYTGLFCEQLDICSLSPCQNGGTCQQWGTYGYFCTCATGYTGQNCTSTLSSTSAATTIAGQTTVSTASTSPANLCTPNPCINGICFQLSPNTSYCSCSSGFSGNLCQFTNPCTASNPCSNGGTCFPQFNSSMYFCSCAPGFTGLTCGIDLRRQCLYNNGNCVNGATCFVDSVTYAARCNCPPLYTGSRCDQYLNPCFNTNGYPVCLNGGRCSVMALSAPYYTCTCNSGYFGNNCEQTQNTTPNPTTCADVDQYICPIYASKQYCNSQYVINGLTIAKFCPVSCGTCPTTTTAASVTTQSATCFDSDPGCSYWSYYCSLLASISPHPCRKTCGLC